MIIGAIYSVDLLNFIGYMNGAVQFRIVSNKKLV
jgi:hypothetical protein